MLDLLKKTEKNNSHKSINENIAFRNYFVHNFYDNYFDNLSSKDLDIEFRNDMQTLVKALKKLPVEEQKTMIKILSNVIEFYVENKIEKELDKSFSKIFRIIG